MKIAARNYEYEINWWLNKLKGPKVTEKARIWLISDQGRQTFNWLVLIFISLFLSIGLPMSKAVNKILIILLLAFLCLLTFLKFFGQ